MRSTETDSERLGGPAARRGGAFLVARGILWALAVTTLYFLPFVVLALLVAAIIAACLR